MPGSKERDIHALLRRAPSSSRLTCATPIGPTLFLLVFSALQSDLLNEWGWPAKATQPAKIDRHLRLSPTLSPPSKRSSISGDRNMPLPLLRLLRRVALYVDGISSPSGYDQPCFRLNPSGLRQKEPHTIELGPGIWGYSETQLSVHTFQTCQGRLRSLARQSQRRLWVHGGAPARLCSKSSWAGTWPGVMTTSDFPSHHVQLPWLSEESACGRLLRHDTSFMAWFSS